MPAMGCLTAETGSRDRGPRSVFRHSERVGVEVLPVVRRRLMAVRGNREACGQVIAIRSND